jgi:hypothetical protein
MGWFYLAVVIVLSTVLWPVARWTLDRDGDPRVMGFWILGIFNPLGLLFTILAFKLVGAEIVLPVTVTSPIVLAITRKGMKL